MEAAAKVPPSDQVRKALEHFDRTGCYRKEDLRRLLGDPAGSVEVGPDSIPDWAKVRE
jgi:hypothetical protein